MASPPYAMGLRHPRLRREPVAADRLRRRRPALSAPARPAGHPLRAAGPRLRLAPEQEDRVMAPIPEQPARPEGGDPFTPPVQPPRGPRRVPAAPAAAAPSGGTTDAPRQRFVISHL